MQFSNGLNLVTVDINNPAPKKKKVHLLAIYHGSVLYMLHEVEI